MTPEEFSGLFHQAAALHRVTLAELQDMAVRFPYAANVRLLLLLKSRLEGHDQEELYLNRCAAACFDRAFVYDLLRQLEKEQAVVAKDEEETLELRELDELELAPIPAGVGVEFSNDYPIEPEYGNMIPGEETERLAAPTEENPQEQQADTPQFPAEPLTSPAQVPDPEPMEQATDHSISTERSRGGAPFSETGARAVPEEPVDPSGTSAPSALQQRLARIRTLQAKRAGEKGKNVNSIARRSLIAHEEVASETLASLLVRQGQYENAIRMYERLILLNPEKKTIFAGLIKDLQEKL